MGYRVGRVLDPAPTGGQAVVLSSMKRGLNVAPAAPLDQYLSSYTSSFANASGGMQKKMPVIARSSSVAVLSQSRSSEMRKSVSLPKLAVESTAASPKKVQLKSPSMSMQQTEVPRLRSMNRSDSMHTYSNAEQQRALLELLGNLDLKKSANQIFKAHDWSHDGFLNFQELRSCLDKLRTEFGIDQMDDDQVERMLKKYDVRCDQKLDFEEFFDMLLALLRNEAFSRRDVINREFFVTKAPGKVWDDYEKLKQLGAGTFGTAYLAKNSRGEERVVKSVKKSRVKIPVEDVEREIMVMRQVDHPHIVRLFQWYEDRTRIYLIMEALKGGTLKEVVLEYQKQRKGLKEDWVREITRQVVSALAYCHTLRLIHKDIKDENIMLLKKEGRFDKPFAVVIDLGVAEMFALADPTGHEVGGSPITMAPEVWQNRFGPKCDVFSMGCVLFELLTGNFPFMATSMNPDAWIRLHRRGPDWTLFKSSPAGKAMCQAMLTFSEEKRPTMANCLKHEWFSIPERELRTVTPAQLMGLQSFAKDSLVKRTLLLELATRLPMERATEIVELFEGLDQDGDGRLSRNELEIFLRKGGVNDNELIGQIWAALDVDENGELSFSEFSAGILFAFKDLLADRLEELAVSYDRGKDGALDKEECGQMMQAVAEALGDETSSTIVEEVLKSKNGSGDQTVNFSDFKNYMMKTPNGSGPDLKSHGSAVSSSRSSLRSGRRNLP